MPRAALLELEPRKAPQQGRSIATVQAIHDATIQVLLKNGAERLTTVEGPGTPLALYRIAAEVAGSLIVDRIRTRFPRSIAAMLQTAPLQASADVSFMADMIFQTMAGTLRAHLESDAPLRLTKKLREHLSRMVLAYCRAM